MWSSVFWLILCSLRPQIKRPVFLQAASIAVAALLARRFGLLAWSWKKYSWNSLRSESDRSGFPGILFSDTMLVIVIFSGR